MLPRSGTTVFLFSNHGSLLKRMVRAVHLPAQGHQCQYADPKKPFAQNLRESSPKLNKGGTGWDKACLATVSNHTRSPSIFKSLGPESAECLRIGFSDGGPKAPGDGVDPFQELMRPSGKRADSISAFATDFKGATVKQPVNNHCALSPRGLKSTEIEGEFSDQFP